MRSFYFSVAAIMSLGSIQAAEQISSRVAKIHNVQLHYLTAGNGPATVILLHGFAETSRMWRPIIPTLAEKFTVIAPDLPGIGDSSIPDKIDMLEAAKQIHDLVRSLKIDKARVVGHDIGADGRVRLRSAIPGRNGEARGDGCVSSRRGRMGTDLQ